MAEEKTKERPNGKEKNQKDTFSINWDDVPEEVLQMLFLTDPKVIVRALS